MSAHEHELSHCENCNAGLQGAYCHACGQSALSPVRHAGHAIEEVFESFWHLDGRVFRTLRDLVFPGRVAINYLAGHRARYIAPLRLFVILSLLTFFVGKLVVHFDDAAVKFDGSESGISREQTIEGVERRRDRLLQQLAKDEKAAANTPGASPALVLARIRIEGEAATRIDELRKAQGITAKPAGSASSASAGSAPTSTASGGDVLFSENWDPKKRPIAVAWLPDFANRWLTARGARARDNLTRMNGDSGAFVKAFMGALPTALFLLVPVFALLLKLLYLGSRRLYLEHLVVALYSHAYMLLALLVSFMLVGVSNAFAARASLAEPLAALGNVALWCGWVPIYLWRMQHRVYRQRWWITTLKYLFTAALYLPLVTFAGMAAFVIGIVGA